MAAFGFAFPHSPLTTHHSPLTTHHSPLTTHHSPPTTHHSPLTTHPPPLTPHHSPPTHHSPLLIYQLLAPAELAKLRNQDAVPQDHAAHAPQEEADQAERQELL